MRRNSILSLTNNADAAALETTRAALTAASGHPVIGGSKVSLHARVPGEAFVSGGMVGFARMPTTLNADRSISAFSWVRWPGGDMGDLTTTGGNDGFVTEPRPVPIGATAVISLPLAVASTGGTTVSLGIFTQAPSFLG